MITKNEAERLAQAVNAFRPDWPIKSLLTFIGRELIGRPFQDVAVALVWVATDPRTQTPKRVLEAGPWWRPVDDRPSGTPTPSRPRCPDHPGQPLDCPTCAEARLSPDELHQRAAALKARLRTHLGRHITDTRPDTTEGTAA
jgi:hypothetical protein